MSIPLFGGAAVLTEHGAVTRDQEVIAEVIQDYDPNLHLAWIPPAARGLDDTKPWAVMHMVPGREPYVVLFAQECDYRILARLWESDNTKGDVFGKVTAMEAAQKAVELRKTMDEEEERKEIAASVLKSKKHSYTAPINGRIRKFQ